MKHIKFPSIEQFRSIVTTVKHLATYVETDSEGKPVYNSLAELPSITFTGTVKLHGTNAGVSFDTSTGELWAQSRENIITPLKDNAGFAMHVEMNKIAYTQLMQWVLLNPYNNIVAGEVVTIFGEWCGQGIQKGVAISELPKMFVIFGCKVTNLEGPEPVGRWIYCDYNLETNGIYNIMQFPIFELQIDFSKPDYALETLSKLTLEVEEKCPVAAALGVEGIGEGIVWSGTYKGEILRFKTKGEKHSKSRVKTLKVTVSADKLVNISKFVEEVTPEWRLQQGLTEVFDLNNGGQLDVKQLGSYLSWVMRDIMKEEQDLFLEYGLEHKEVGKYITDIARKYFLTEYNRFK